VAPSTTSDNTNNDGILDSEHVRPFWIGEKASIPPTMRLRLTNTREEYNIIAYIVRRLGVGGIRDKFLLIIPTSQSNR
jgi:hypothetical protein